MKRTPILDRIRAAYKPGIDYGSLILKVFPPKDYPRAHRCSSNGGPPGCAFAFGAALRRHGFVVDSERRVWGW